MEIEEFYNLLELEIAKNPKLRKYYKFIDNNNSKEFRKIYFLQRLKYIKNNITNKSDKIWDCGCGYGTTAIFLALNGFTIKGTTIEYYHDEIENRIKYWNQFGDVKGFTYEYQNVLNSNFNSEKFEIILLQDTLHHIEPLGEALKIFHNSLNDNGKILLVEENGNNIIQNFKLFLRRGNNKIIKIYDEIEKKEILLGNENIRSLKKWNKEFLQNGFSIDFSSVQYIRFFPPFFFRSTNTANIILKEQSIWKKNKFLKEYFYFGLNFFAIKTNHITV